MPREKKQHLKRRPDGRFACRYKDQWFYGDTEDEALKAREAYRLAEKTGDILRPSVTVREYASAWLPVSHPGVSDSTYRGLAIHLEKLLSHVGDDKLAEVKPIQIKNVYSSEYAGVSDSYIRGGKQLFTALFDAALDDGLIKSNPARAKSAQPHKGTVGGRRAITEQERWWIEHYCTDHRAHAAVMAMLYAGLRPQEMKALQIERSVDFQRGTITLCDFAHKPDPYTYQITGKGKTDNAARTIPLFTPLRRALEGKTGFLVTDAEGERVNVQAWKCVWKSYVFQMETAINGCEKRWYGKTKAHKAILAAGGELPPWQSFTVVPYDLRHSFCTMCRDHGVELNTCIQWMGHADAKMILKVYDEVSDHRSQTEAEKIEQTYRALNGSQDGSQKDNKDTGSVDNKGVA